MDSNALGYNVIFQIYNANGTPFNGLKLRKSSVESVVMSLGDKVEGSVYYPDNTLAVTMQEYIIVDDVKYYLVSPPTIVREGMVSDNSELKGMTRYSFVFYHPMYMLGNFEFTDIAVTSTESKYKSQDKTFYWIGSLFEMIAKLNANLSSTEWVVGYDIAHYEQDGVTETAQWKKASKISEVLQFDKNFVSDVLKTSYEQWKIPFVITKIPAEDIRYSSGKKFAIIFGLPTQEIYDSDDTTPYVFRFGQGVGLKNNSRTPKNNKIVTRIIGCGSERNIPFGYPQIPWYGNPQWEYTEYENGVPTPRAYPLYWGIVNGVRTRLIKHPFTRKTLMPSVYSLSVFNKVSPYVSGGGENPDYKPDAEIIDYYDAVDDATHSYPNNINLKSPSAEFHQFEDVYPRLNDQVGIVSASPYDTEESESVSYEKITTSDFDARITNDINSSKNQNEIAALHRLQNAIHGYGTEHHEISNGGSYTYQCDASKVGDVWYVQYTSDNVNYNYGIAFSWPSVVWDDTMDDDGKYKQTYFKIVLPRLDFDVYACASITEEMVINMQSGDCRGCSFTVQVDWDDYKRNFFLADGTFDPIPHTQSGDGHVRDITKYPDSSRGSIEVIVQKDLNTFGTIMPNTYQTPESGDKIVFLGISLPFSYINNAEVELDDAMKEYMLENNIHYYDYPLKFDEHFLATRTDILSQIHNNSCVRFQYAGSEMALYVKQITVKYGDSTLPQYDITLTDDIEVVLNKIGQVTDDVSRMQVQVSELQKYYSENIINELNNKLSKVVDDVCSGRITFQQGLDAIGSVILSNEIRSSEYENGLGGKGWRVDHLGNAEFESARIRSYLEVIQLLINRQQAQEGDTVYADNDQIDRVTVVSVNGSTSYILSLKEKWDGYITSQMYGNILKGVINTLAAKQAGVSNQEYNNPSKQGSDDGGNKYYTSWMRVIGTHATDNSLSPNQIRVVLYGDDEVPAQKNFPPCELMTIVRRGCVDYSDPSSADYQSVKESIIRRQRFFEISASDGRVVKYTGVDRPTMLNGNYGVTIGELPQFVKNYPSVQEVLSRVGEHTDWLYAQGIVVGNLIKIDKEGLPIVVNVDCGEWVDGASIPTPTPKHGQYLYDDWNEETQQYETHDVWHNGLKWRCLQNQPVIVGGTTTYYEPQWNSEYWRPIEGDKEYKIIIESSAGVVFNSGAVVSVLTPRLYYGNIDITSRILSSAWSWQRRTESGKTSQDTAWDNNHTGVRVLNLTNNDMPAEWSPTNKAKFKVTVVVSDVSGSRTITNE